MWSIRSCGFLLLLLPWVGSLAAVPLFVTSAETARVVAGSPNDDPESWLLAFIDVETTGLVPGWHEMIDIGVVMAELDGSEIDALHVRVQPDHPERTSEAARRVNAFDEERWRELGAVDAQGAADQLRDFHRRVAGSRPVLFVAFNSQFDAAFLDYLFRRNGGSWRELFHFFVLDIPSMAWSQGLRGLSGSALATELGIDDEPRVAEEHTGLTGAWLNVRIYRALEARRVLNK